jgi:hypothetical protein
MLRVLAHPVSKIPQTANETSLRIASPSDNRGNIVAYQSGYRSSNTALRREAEKRIYGGRALRKRSPSVGTVLKTRVCDGG